MEEMTKTSEKLVSGYSLLQNIEEVEIGTTPEKIGMAGRSSKNVSLQKRYSG